MKTRKVLKLGSGSTQSRLVEEAAPQKTEEPKGKFLQVLSIASELGFAISLPIAGGALLGQLLDAKFNAAPRMTLSFIFVGVFLAGANIFFIVKESKET